MSETAKHRDRVIPFCQITEGGGIDIGSAGDPVVPWAIQMDLPAQQFKAYNASHPDKCIHWRGYANTLPFKDGTLSFVHASHVLEDFPDWQVILNEWDRVLRRGGYMLIAVPDHERFRAYVQRHKDQGLDVDNLAHRRESFVGDLTKWLEPMGYHVMFDDFVSSNPQEYSILCIAFKPMKPR